MHIEPGHAVSSSRPIQPIESSAKVSRRAAEPSRATASDAISFEAVYQSQLPRVPMTDAHRKLERIRSQLVAGNTDVPIHFDESSPRPAGSRNPFAAAYPRLIGDPGTINANLTASATERSA